MLIDDDADSRDLLKEILTLNGFEVETAATGRDGIQLVRRFKPNLVMVDLGLPDLDGYELAARLRGMKETRGLPVVAVTGRRQSQRFEKLDLVYFDEFITKPFHFTELIHAIRPLLGLELPTALGPDKASEGGARMAWLRARYQSRLDERLRSIRKLWDDHRERPDGPHLKELRGRVHVLAGSAPLYGFENVGRVARAIQESVDVLIHSGDGPAASTDYAAATADVEALVEELVEQHDEQGDGAHAPEAIVAQFDEGESDPPGVHHRVRVLVVDDDPDLLEFLRDRLDCQGYDVNLAADGLRALEAVRQSPPEVIVADVRMPGIDGVELCRQVRREAFHDIPFIFCSGLGSTAERLEGLRAGADDYLVKPIVVDELVAKICRLVETRRRLLAALARSQDPRSTGIISGEIEEIPLNEALQIMTLIGQGGFRLVANAEGAHEVEVRILGRRLTAARFGSVTGAKALHRMLGLERGTFIIEHDRSSAEPTMSMGLEEALLEGTIALDRIRAIHDKLGSTDGALFVQHHPTLFMQSFDPETAQVLMLVEKLHDLGAILDASSMSDLEILRILATLIDDGLVRGHPDSVSCADAAMPNETPGRWDHGPDDGWRIVEPDV